ncbi:hypothetical protein [Streptomyces sp. NPDC054849]
MMNSQTHRAISGYVDAIPAPGTGRDTACFDLIHSPADADRCAPDTPDTVYACTTGHPRIADVFLRDIHGSRLRLRRHRGSCWLMRSPPPSRPAPSVSRRTASWTLPIHPSCW